MSSHAASLGGKATAYKLRMQALKSYYQDPNHCQHCDKIIEVLNQKVAEVRKKKFCSKSCAASFNNIQTPKRIKLPKSLKIKAPHKYENLTKGELFALCANWQSARSCIQGHARLVLLKSEKAKECLICGYTNHVETCHIKPVAMFLETDLISDINHHNNLTYLCPNHHWEYDNGILPLR